ncbi:MAG: aminotransferase class V-fold PLP-dependent enzyme [Actinobacteria bacterium]|nr:aminotransferase class V-fold PLP-dependent enzyme [Actinomycetota bacterium]
MSDPMLTEWRSRFPILARKTYFNSCSQGAQSDAAAQAYRRFLQDWDEKGSPWEYWIEQEEAVRTAFSRLIGATSDEIAVTTSVSAGVSSLIGGFPLDPARNRIVTTDLEFPTIGQIMHAQERRGLEVVHVPAEDGVLRPESFAGVIDERTALVAVTHVCYRNGARSDVEGIVALARAAGAPVLLDSYQAIGAVDIDVKRLGVDFLVTGALKYLLGSAGLGFLYCRSDLIEEIVPTATGWFADEDVFAMDVGDYSPSTTARRFQTGTPPIPAIYAGLAGIEMIRDVGVATIERHIAGLTSALIAGVEEMAARVVTPSSAKPRGPMVAIAAADVDVLVDRLGSEGIVTSSRDGNLRVSCHGYNSQEDVARLLDALRRNRDLLA